jgi:thioredoxin-dependent peroxiredoxin
MSQHTVNMKGTPLPLEGELPKIGEQAPEFTAAANDLSPFALSSLKGKTVILSAVPSLDTPVCDLETRRFNKEAAALGADVAVVTVSMDLPFAQKRWCGAAGIDRVVTVSDYNQADFGKKYGVLISPLHLLARAIFVVDPKGVLRYTQVVPEVTTEPDYSAVLQAVKEAKK